ncbi:MAG: PfkB family carbohydrate kinase, partial [Candidatus Dormibacteraceae bacterium]
MLSEVGSKAVCITRGHLGCIFLRGSSYRAYDAYTVEADDATGAGDAFCAALALPGRRSRARSLWISCFTSWK